MADITELINMKDNDLQKWLIKKLSEKIIRRRFSVEDYEILLQDLEMRWPCGNLIGLYDSRVRKKGNGWIAICGVTSYTDLKGETAPDIFRDQNLKPVVFFFSKKQEVINYYHDLQNVPEYIYRCCEKFWQNYNKIDRESLSDFSVQQRTSRYTAVQWTVVPSYIDQVHTYTLNTSNSMLDISPNNDQVYSWIAQEAAPNITVEVQEPGKILMFALKWTQEIWKRNTL